MLWSYIEKKVKNSLYPDIYYWSPNLSRIFRKSIYIKNSLNIKFEYIPERWSSMFYNWYFGRQKGYHYPTDDDIKFFYFTLFKKNGFLFIIFCFIIYKNYFFEVIILLIKSFIAFYLILYLIYIVLFLYKYLYRIYKMLKKVPSKYFSILIIIGINYSLNIIFNFKKNSILKWYF